MWTHHLQDAIGILEGHILAPKTVEIYLPNPCFSRHKQKEEYNWPLREMAEQQLLIRVQDIPTKHCI